MVKRRYPSPYQEILTRVGSPSPRDFGVPPSNLYPYFCDEIEAAIAAKQLLVEWHQSQISTASPAEKAAHIQRIKQLQEEIQALTQRLEDCMERPPAPILAIAGIERTQATQYFYINGQGSNFATDNSVPLVSNRALLLRVYVDDRRSPSVLPRWVSGRVRYRLGASTQTSVLNSLNGSIPARPVGAVDRGEIGDTLNFRIPAHDCHHTLQITVDVFDPATIDPEVGFVTADVTRLRHEHAITPADSVTFFVHFEPVPAFAVRVVPINYRGGGLNLPAPSGLQFASDFLLTLDAFPIARLVFGDCVGAVFDGDLGSMTGWDELWNYLRRLNGQSSEIIVGLVPKDVPGSAVRGIGGGGAAAALAGDPQVLAHEIGHALGRMHAPNVGCIQPGGFGCPAHPDPNYPRYGNYLVGSIGEFGVNRIDLTVFNPRYVLDLMSYSYLYYRTGWVSPYTYMGLWHGMVNRFGMARSALNDATSVPAAWLYLEFSVDRDGAVTLHPSFIREGPPAPAVGFGPTPISCELADESGRVIHSQRCTLWNPYQDAEDPSLFLSEALPWSSRARTIRFRRNGEVIDTIDIEDVEPSIAVAPPKVTKQTVTVEWRAEHSGQRPLLYLVEYSNDNGRTWHTVAQSNNTRCEFDLDSLAGGDQCRFRVLASSGVRTASAESEPFAVRQRPRRAFILSPARDEQIVAGQNVTLRGGAFAPGLGLTDDEDTLLMSSVDGVLGYGHEVVCRLSQGLHEVTLTVPDGLGDRASAKVTIISRAPGVEGDRGSTG